MMNNNNAIRSPKQAADWLGLSPSTMAKLRLSGDGPVFIKLGARRVGYRQVDLETWVDAHVRRSTSDQ